MWCQPLLCVQRNFLQRLRFGTNDTGPLQYASHSGSLVACRSTASASARLILSSAADTFQQAFNSSPTCFAVSLLSHMTSSQVQAPRTTFTEAPSFEVCSAKVGPRYFVSHQHFSKEARHHLMSNALSLPSGDHGHSKYSVRVPSPPTQELS